MLHPLTEQATPQGCSTHTAAFDPGLHGGVHSTNHLVTTCPIFHCCWHTLTGSVNKPTGTPAAQPTMQSPRPGPVPATFNSIHHVVTTPTVQCQAGVFLHFTCLPCCPPTLLGWRSAKTARFPKSLKAIAPRAPAAEVCCQQLSYDDWYGMHAA
jgi:hypothetical protein